MNYNNKLEPHNKTTIKYYVVNKDKYLIKATFDTLSKAKHFTDTKFNILAIDYIIIKHTVTDIAKVIN